MKKIFSFIFVLMFVFNCVSCTGSAEESRSDPDTLVSADAVPLEVISDGNAAYSVVCSENCSASLYASIESFLSAVYEYTGISIGCIKDSQADKDNGKYILVGNTCFEQSSNALASLPSNTDAYTIERAGEHIVFAGHYDSALAAALSYFVDTLMIKNYDANTKTLVFEEWCFDGSDAVPASFVSSDIAKYSIVYCASEDGYEQIAQTLKDRIKTLKGVDVSVFKDTDSSESAREILIGRTNRDLSSLSFKDGASLMAYKMVVDKGQLQIVCGGPYSAKMAVNKLINTVIEDGNDLSTGEHLESDLAKESIPLTRGADVRIMSANILSEGAIKQPDRFPKSVQRAEILAKILVDYTPDIVGIQEMDINYHAPLQRYLQIIKETYGIEYSMVLERHNGAVNSSPIIYRSDKFRLDYRKFSPVQYHTEPYNDEYSTGVSSAKFTSVNDPDLQIAMLSAHWHWEKEGVSEIPKQYYDATCMANEFKYLEATYPGVHVFCTGDFNSHRFKRQYLNQLVDDIQGQIASDIAIANGVFKASFKHQGQLIDHIIGKAGTFDVLLHAPTQNRSENLTDHQPIFADIKFK